MKTREIERVVQGNRQSDGVGVSLLRVFGYHDVQDFDQFLMLDAFDELERGTFIRREPH